MMMFRSWMIFVVAQECRKAEGKQDSINFLLEHPSASEEMPEIVSIWRTSSWKQLKKIYGKRRTRKWNDEAYSLGTNLKLEFPKVGGCKEEKED